MTDRLTCPKCGATFTTREELIVHTKTHVRPTKSYVEQYSAAHAEAHRIEWEERRKATDKLAPETKQLIDENINPEYRESAYKYAADKQRLKDDYRK